MKPMKMVLSLFKTNCRNLWRRHSEFRWSQLGHDARLVCLRTFRSATSKS